MLDCSRFDWLSFDCYGTLIDWESGIFGYLRPLLLAKGCDISDARILALYSEFEPQEQAGHYRSYREVLADVVRDFARELHFEVSESEANGLAESIRDWQPFANTALKLEVRFDAVVTAQQVHSYKPSLNNFEALLRRYAIPRERLLHVAESLYHDVAPAHKLGIASVWVNRRQGKQPAATKLVNVKPDLEVPDIRRLAELAAPGEPHS